MDQTPPVELNLAYRIQSEEVIHYGVLRHIYPATQRIGFMTRDDAIFTKRGCDRYDFATLIEPNGVAGMFTGWSKDGVYFEKPGYTNLEIVLATSNEIKGLRESYK